MRDKPLDVHAVPVRPDGEYLLFHRVRQDWIERVESSEISERRHTKNWADAWVFKGRNLHAPDENKNQIYDAVPISDAVEIENRDKLARGLES